MVKSDNPTIALIKNKTSLTSARALIALAICEVCDFFNVGKNMNDIQIAMTADLILESFGHLKLEELKYCFRRAMRQGKVFDRIDGNVLISWVREYDDERTEVVMTLSHNKEVEERQAVVPDETAITAAEYRKLLHEQLASGDKEAQKKLEALTIWDNQPSLSSLVHGAREKECKFKHWFYSEYQHKKK